jgi:hypothetical protein
MTYLYFQAYCKFGSVPVDVKATNNPWKSPTGKFMRMLPCERSLSILIKEKTTAKIAETGERVSGFVRVLVLESFGNWSKCFPGP